MELKQVKVMQGTGYIYYNTIEELKHIIKNLNIDKYYLDKFDCNTEETTQVMEIPHIETHDLVNGHVVYLKTMPVINSVEVYVLNDDECILKRIECGKRRSKYKYSLSGVVLTLPSSLNDGKVLIKYIKKINKYEHINFPMLFPTIKAIANIDGEEFPIVITHSKNCMDVYVHYGDGNVYNKENFKPIKNIDYNNVEKIPDGQTTKPKFGTGLWASNINSPLNWRALCYAYDFEQLKYIKNKNYFLFTFKPDANIVHINTPDDLEKIPHLRNIRGKEYNILFEEALEQGIDAIELHLESEYRYELDEYLYGWDCSSVLVLNPDSVEELFTTLEDDTLFGHEIF